jgi:hypothetical protein
MHEVYNQQLQAAILYELQLARAQEAGSHAPLSEVDLHTAQHGQK